MDEDPNKHLVKEDTQTANQDGKDAHHRSFGNRK